MCDVF